MLREREDWQALLGGLVGWESLRASSRLYYNIVGFHMASQSEVGVGPINIETILSISEINLHIS